MVAVPAATVRVAGARDGLAGMEIRHLCSRDTSARELGKPLPLNQVSRPARARALDPPLYRCSRLRRFRRRFGPSEAPFNESEGLVEEFHGARFPFQRGNVGIEAKVGRHGVVPMFGSDVRKYISVRYPILSAASRRTGRGRRGYVELARAAQSRLRAAVSRFPARPAGARGQGRPWRVAGR